MKALRYLFLTLVVILVAAVAATFLIPSDAITRQVASIAKERTGRDLTVNGAVKFSVYPNLAVSVGDVTVSNPDGMPKGVFVAADNLRLALELMPLLGGNVKVKSFELEGPRFNLLTDVNGNSNWNFETAGAPQDSPADPSDGDTDTARSVTLDDVRIVNGVVRYLDETVGAAFEGTDINVSVSLPDMEGNLELSGSMVWRGETVDLDTSIGPVGRLSREKTADIDLKLKSAHLTSNFKGTLSLANGFALNGSIDAGSPSLRQLAAWSGQPLAPGPGLGPFKATSSVQVAQDRVMLNNARLNLDGMRAQGGVTVATGGPRPQITASLGVDQIDLNTYLGKPDASPSASRPDAGTAWSNDPISFVGLKAVDADLRLVASRILFRKATIDNSQLDVTIKDGQLAANLKQLALYDGNASGTLTLDGTASTPVITARFVSTGLAALPLLRDFADFDWIEGTSKFTGNLTATGGSQRQLVENLNGSLNILFEDGAIRGINIAQMMRGLGTNILSGWEREATKKTDFASLSASYLITKGVAVNSDLAMLGPLVRMTGSGNVQMPGQRLDYTVDPKLVASLKGQGGNADLAGFNVPIKIKGPWSKPEIYPDIAGILDNPEEALKKLQAIGNIDPEKLGLGVDQILTGSTDTVKETGKKVQETIQEVIKPDSDVGETLNNILQGFGKND